MRENTVVYESANDGGWGAYVPDLSGLGVVGDTREEAHQLSREGTAIQIAGLIEDGLAIPKPSSYVGLIVVPAA